MSGPRMSPESRLRGYGSAILLSADYRYFRCVYLESPGVVAGPKPEEGGKIMTLKHTSSPRMYLHSL